MAVARRPPVAPPAGGSGSTPLRPPPLTTNINVVDTRPAPRQRTGWRKWTNLQWKGTTTDPVLGNGTLNGWVKFDDRWLEVWIELLMGSTTTYGTGSWYFTGRPVVTSPFDPLLAVGQAGYRDAAPANFSGPVMLVGGLLLPRLYDHSAADGTMIAVTATAPFTWASGDSLTLSAKYRYTD